MDSNQASITTVYFCCGVMLPLYSDYSDIIETLHYSKYCSKCMQELYTHVAPYTSSFACVCKHGAQVWQ